MGHVGPGLASGRREGGTRNEVPAPAELGSVVLADIEEKGVRMKLTVIDTPGFGDHINNENW